MNPELPTPFIDDENSENSETEQLENCYRTFHDIVAPILTAYPDLRDILPNQELADYPELKNAMGHYHDELQELADRKPDNERDCWFLYHRLVGYQKVGLTSMVDDAFADFALLSEHWDPEIAARWTPRFEERDRMRARYYD